MPLDEYRRKRDFSRTPEPDAAASADAALPDGSGTADVPDLTADSRAAGAAMVAVTSGTAARRFVVGRHRARRLHYDLRLEVDGALASWAVPLGPTLDPAVRRMAVHVEDHPIEYLDFEDVIPAGEYGGGDAIVWDRGTYEPEATDDPAAAITGGELKFSLSGEKLRGRFTLVRTRSGDGRQWLLIKKRDAGAVAGWNPEDHPRSVLSGRTNEEMRAARAGASRAGRDGAGPGGGAPHSPVTSGAAPLAPTGVAPMPGVVAPMPGVVAPMPDFVEPMAATLATEPFDDPDWLFEVKWDGYRVQAHVRAGRVVLRSRSGLDAGAWFPGTFEPPAWVAADEAILDGEIVALDDDGSPDFSRLQAHVATGATGARVASRLRSGRTSTASARTEATASAETQGGRSSLLARAPLTYQVFDLLYLDGRLLIDVPLEERLRLLRSVLREHPRVRYGGSIEGEGRAFFAAAEARGLEGIVAKHRSSHYEPGRRSGQWLKLKVRPEQEFVVAGYAKGRGTHADLGSLLLAVRDETRGEEIAFRYVGRVGSGLDARTRRTLRAALDARTADRPTVTNPDAARTGRDDIRWAEPEIVIRVRFGGWTRDGLVRQSAFAGIRLDRDASDVIRERPMHERAIREQPTGGQPIRAAPSPAPPADSTVPSDGTTANLRVGGRLVRLTNLDRILFPADGVAKRDLVRYCLEIAPVLLPHLAGRPLNLSRYPGGIDAPGFWQRELPRGAPAWLTTWREPEPAGREAHTYVLATDGATLAWIANSAAIEIHPWTSRADAPDRPTHALIDIDPGEHTTFDEVVVLARLFRTALTHLGLRSYPKLTGKRGLQVFIPIRPAYTFDEVRDWVLELSRAVGAVVPDLVSWEWSVDRRGGLARLDFTQNAPNKTLVAAYSVRAVPGAPVSAPIEWSELDDPDLRPNRWTIRSVGERVRQRGDLFAGALELDQDLPRL